VTNPTTIRAITEIPANTPNPIGKTDKVFPGSWKGAADVLAASAAAADAVVARELVPVNAVSSPATAAVVV
jgi:hypothetical protein